MIYDHCYNFYKFLVKTYLEHTEIILRSGDKSTSVKEIISEQLSTILWAVDTDMNSNNVFLSPEHKYDWLHLSMLFKISMAM